MQRDIQNEHLGEAIMEHQMSFLTDLTRELDTDMLPQLVMHEPGQCVAIKHSGPSVALQKERSA